MSHHQSAVCISAYTVVLYDRSHTVARKQHHLGRLSGEGDIRDNLGHCDRRMIKFSFSPLPVLQTIVDIDCMDPIPRGASRACA